MHSTHHLMIAITCKTDKIRLINSHIDGQNILLIVMYFCNGLNLVISPICIFVTLPVV